MAKDREELDSYLWILVRAGTRVPRWFRHQIARPWGCLLWVQYMVYLYPFMYVSYVTIDYIPSTIYYCQIQGQLFEFCCQLTGYCLSVMNGYWHMLNLKSKEERPDLKSPLWEFKHIYVWIWSICACHLSDWVSSEQINTLYRVRDYPYWD